MSVIKPQNDFMQNLLNPSANKNQPGASGLAGLLNPNDKAATPGAANLNDFFSPSSKGLQAVAASQQYQQAYSYSHTMTMQIQTKEGDTLQVDFRQLYAEYQSYKSESRQEEGPSGARYFESREAMEATAFEERFGFSVQGDLNEDELGAIFDVFEQVDQLANEFYNGDIEKAFAKAQDLDIDFGQIQSFDLNLQKSEMFASQYQQTQAYQGVQNTGAEQAANQGGEVSQLPPYLQKMQEVVARMDEFFASAREKFDEMLANTVAQRAGEEDKVGGWYERIKAFHDQLAEASGLDKETLKPSGAEIEGLTPTEAAEKPLSS
ncbi:MAG: hypothetical protein ACP5D0_01790 [Hydrogenovibrio sp.]